MEAIRLNVHHIHCGGCENRIQTVLNRQPGVKTAKASQQSQTVDVEFDPAQIDTQRLKETIERAGFEVRGAA